FFLLSFPTRRSSDLLLMMVLPLLSAYFLFVSISNYYDTKKVDQFYEVKSRLSNLHPILRDPTMYTGNLNESLLDAHKIGCKLLKDRKSTRLNSSHVS